MQDTKRIHIVKEQCLGQYNGFPGIDPQSGRKMTSHLYQFCSFNCSATKSAVGMCASATTRPEPWPLVGFGDVFWSARLLEVHCFEGAHGLG
jgi:hypothetical protein